MAVFEDLCVQLGVLLKLAKKIAPTRNITIIGWVFDSLSHSVELSPSKRSKIIDICRDYLKPKSLTLHQLQILGGNLNHAAAVIPGSSLRIQWLGRAASMAYKKRTYVLSPYDRRQLYWWMVMLADSECKVRITDPTLRQVLNIWSPRASNCSIVKSADQSLVLMNTGSARGPSGLRVPRGCMMLTNTFARVHPKV